MLTHFARLKIVLILLVAVSCANHRTDDRGPPQIADASEYELVVRENFEELRFEVHLNSKTQRALCIDKHCWPNRFGQLHFASERVHVTVNNVQYPIQARNFGYPIPSSAYSGYEIVPAAAAIYGFIAFTEFDQAMYANPNDSRVLYFKVEPHVCPEPSVPST